VFFLQHSPFIGVLRRQYRTLPVEFLPLNALAKRFRELLEFEFLPIPQFAPLSLLCHIKQLAAFFLISVMFIFDADIGVPTLAVPAGVVERFGFLIL